MAEPNIIHFPARTAPESPETPGQARYRVKPLKPLLSFQTVTLTRGGTPILRGVQFDMAPDGLTALIGPNGAGKSFVLKLAAGLIAPDTGGIERAHDLSRIAYVPQRPVLLRRSVKGNLAHALRLAGLRGPALRARLDALLELGRLTSAAAQPARSLSGGEAQRLTLVRALARDPALLLLDEPCASLDPASTARLEVIVREIGDRGTRVLLVTHDLAQARRLAEHVVVLSQGRVAEAGNSTLLYHPKSPETLAFLQGRLPGDIR